MVERHRLGQLHKRALGGTISRPPDGSDMPKLGSDQDNAAATAFDDRRKHGAAHQIRSCNLNREQTIPVRQPNLKDVPRWVVVGCTVNQNMHAAPARLDFRRDGQGPIFIRYITSQGKGICAGSAGCSSSLFRLIQIDASYARSGFGEGERDRGSDPPSRASDYGGFASEREGIGKRLGHWSCLPSL